MPFYMLPPSQKNDQSRMPIYWVFIYVEIYLRCTREGGERCSSWSMQQDGPAGGEAGHPSEGREVRGERRRGGGGGEEKARKQAAQRHYPIKLLQAVPETGKQRESQYQQGASHRDTQTHCYYGNITHEHRERDAGNRAVAHTASVPLHTKTE